MSTQDVFFVIQWWAILSLAGIVFLPLTSILFSSFIDKGYAFSKIMGVIVISYVIFLLGVLRIAPFLPATIYAVFILLVIINVFLFFKKNPLTITKQTLMLFMFEEVLFFLALLSWSYVRGFSPDIYGLEKYMDFGFVNSILRSTYFPPKDMWFTPFPINYYYFGHFITAVLTKASGIPSYITFNLMIATLFALSFVESFSLGVNLLIRFTHNHRFHIFRPIVGGLLIACLVTLAGNLHIIYSFFKVPDTDKSPYAISSAPKQYDPDKPIPPWEMQFSITNPCYEHKSYVRYIDGKKQVVNCMQDDQTRQFDFPNAYWYPNATRFIYHTIHEFPIYSWVVSDLHGHVLDIPIVLLTITVLFSFFLFAETNNEAVPLHKQENHKTATIKVAKATLFYLISLGILLAIMYMTNAWDGITYLLLASVILVYLNWQRVEQQIMHPLLHLSNYSSLQQYKQFITRNKIIDFLIGLGISLVIIGSTFFVLSRPFSANFDPSKIVGGIGVLCAPSFMYQAEKTATGTIYQVNKIGPFLFEPEHCQKSPWWQLLILYGFFYFFVTAFFIFLWKKKNLYSSDTFVLILIITSTILITIPEFAYMKDIYPEHYRANTMFKLVFQAFILLSIASGYIIIRTIGKKTFSSLSVSKKAIYSFYFLLTVILLSLVFTYPYFAIRSYYGDLKNYQGLNGLKYLEGRNKGDYEAIVWLNAHVKDQPSILEAQGDSYTDYERISANTGLPTVLGWYVHEWLWRGEKAPQSRADLVKTMYETTDLTEARSLLQQFNIKYVVVGNLELQKYPNLSEDKFNKLGKLVFQSDGTKIYEINQ